MNKRLFCFKTNRALIISPLMKIGVLELQGDYQAHEKTLRAMGYDVVGVRYPEQLETVRGLIMPGGESTAMRKLSENLGVLDAVREFAARGRPVFGTCAGLILLSEKIDGQPNQGLGLLPVSVARNAYGPQKESFEALLRLAFDPQPFPGVFIRAPVITDTGRAEPLAWFGDQVVAVRHGNIMGASFHPELTSDTRFHRFFLNMAR